MWEMSYRVFWDGNHLKTSLKCFSISSHGYHWPPNWKKEQEELQVQIRVWTFDFHCITQEACWTMSLVLTSMHAKVLYVSIEWQLTIPLHLGRCFINQHACCQQLFSKFIKTITLDYVLWTTSWIYVERTLQQWLRMTVCACASSQCWTVCQCSCTNIHYWTGLI